MLRNYQSNFINYLLNLKITVSCHTQWQSSGDWKFSSFIICLPRTFHDADIWRRSPLVFNITLHQTKFRVNTQIATLTARCVCWCTFHDGPLYREIFILSPQIPNVLRQFSFILQFGVIEGLLMIVEPRFKRICRHSNISFGNISALFDVTSSA